jgi:hypothetical protein
MVPGGRQTAGTGEKDTIRQATSFVKIMDPICTIFTHCTKYLQKSLPSKCGCNLLSFPQKSSIKIGNFHIHNILSFSVITHSRTMG